MSTDITGGFLVLRAQAGDRAALEQLLTAISLPLFNYIRTLVNSKTLAEDILQEVLLLIYRKLGWLREPALFRAWAYRLTTRLVFKQLKRERQWQSQLRDEALLASLPATEAPLDRETIDQLLTLLDTLSPAIRAVVALHYWHEMTLPEVAAVMDIPLGTVKSRLAAGLARLREQISTR